MGMFGWFKEMILPAMSAGRLNADFLSGDGKISNPLKDISQKHHVRHGELLVGYINQGEQLRKQFYQFRKLANSGKNNSIEIEAHSKLHDQNLKNYHAHIKSFRKAYANSDMELNSLCMQEEEIVSLMSSTIKKSLR